MMGSEAILCVLVVHLLLAAESLVISPRWSHLRWKTVAPARVDVRASGQVVLTCTATGSPAPAVAWFKDGLFVPHLELIGDQTQEHARSLGETVARLRLSCASKETVGKYECRARAGEQELSAVTQVELADWSEGDLCSEAGTPEVATWSPTLMVEEGTNAVLRCRAMSGEVVTTTWLNDKGEQLGEGERHSVTDSGNLIVRDVSFADMGTYTCRLTNKMGSDQVDTFLYPLAPGL